MSGFWDAVERAALGLPGGAEPRSRSMFEDDDPTLALEEVESPPDDSLRQEPAAAQTLVPHLVPVAPGIDRSAASSELRVDRVAESVGAPELARAATIEHLLVRAQDAPPERASIELPARKEEPSPPLLRRALELSDPESPHRDAEPLQRAERPHPQDRVDEATPPAPIEPRTAVSQTRASDVQLAEAEPVLPRGPVIEPFAFAMPPPELHADAPQPPLVIEIDRIEIRVESDRPPERSSTRRSERPAPPSLDLYLAGRPEVRP